MENLNAEQIIKALKCCGEYTHGTTCNNCPYMHIELADNEICSNRMSQDALALINSQEQRIKELNEENERYKRYYLNHEYDKMEADIRADVQDEMDNLYKCVLEEKHLRYQAEEMLANGMSVVKANTVSELQNRLAKSIGTYTDKSFVYVNAWFKLLDQIAKEILEGDNG